jgi:hypothetical protein
VGRTVPPSAEIEEQIDRLLAVGVGENPRESLSELAKLGARLIIQRAVEDEFDAWLGRARYERRPDYQRGLRNGFRPKRAATAPPGSIDASALGRTCAEPAGHTPAPRAVNTSTAATHANVVRSLPPRTCEHPRCSYEG